MTYQNMTYEKVLEEATEALVGTCMDTIEEHLAFYLERQPTQKEVDDAEKLMAEKGIQNCECCGWWQSDNDGINGDLCWQCADDEAMRDEDEE